MFHFSVLVLSAALLIPITPCQGQLCLPKEHASLFILGDSIFDAGNNNYINTTNRANFYPYGKTFFKYPTGRFSKGRVIPDFIAEYAKLLLIPPYLHPGYHRYTDGANFASAGAGALSETYRGLEIYKIGGRKFGFPNIWPLGCVPYTRAMVNTGACVDELTQLAKLHEERLSEVLQKLESHLHGFRYSLFNSNNATTKRINSPSRYGFKEGKTACCGSGPYRGITSCGLQGSGIEYELCEDASEYVFFDSSHPSERTNQQLAELMWSGTPDTTRPYNLKALFEL